MEHDLTLLTEEEINFWCEEYPDLDREEVIEILLCLDVDTVKNDFWKDNPTLPENAVNKVVAENAAASYEHHLYHDLNNEAP